MASRPTDWTRPGSAIWTLLGGISAWIALAGPAGAAEWDEAANLLRVGRYEACADRAGSAIEGGARDERWFALRIRAELARGRYESALACLDEASRVHPSSVGLFLLGRDVRRFNGRGAGESTAAAEFERRLVDDPPWVGSPEAKVALGRFLLDRGVDAKVILDKFYDAAIRQQPEFLDAHLASAELALAKQDFGLAAEALAKAPADAAKDPHFHELMAMAFAEDDRARSARSLAEALKINPDHADSLLLQVDELIDAERYAEAEVLIARVIAVNPRQPRAWAYRAVLAHLRNNPDGEAEARRSALARWGQNPEVDSLIGRKLADKYRFAEGAQYQRRALLFDPDHAPAKLQLCQALLRLGEEAEGWKLAEEISQGDAYNVVAFNLITLRDRLAGFRTIQADGIVVRMDPHEADLYGGRVLDLLRRAKSTLGARYEAELPGPVYVEIFPRKNEFAVRTFGLPGADGLLGVCFGPVITANSPASQGETPANWEAVLWHELCHAITLAKTRNRMPRWLSEGISVHEEGEQNAAWRTPFDPRTRAMILGDELTPLSQLSSAFLAPESPFHLQFAYRESALAVEFLIEKVGRAGLNGILDDLGAGKTINEALPDRARMTLEELDREFAAFARRRAASVAPDATWEEIDLDADAKSDAVAAWLVDRPRSFLGRQRLAARLVAEGKWAEAKDAILSFRALDPGYVGPENSYAMLATVHAKLADPVAERATLVELADRDGDALAAYLRLMELDEAAGDWQALASDARRALAVNPLIAAPHRGLARADEELDARAEAVAEYRAAAAIDDADPADVHSRIARLLHRDGKPDEARREVLKSLDEAPRSLDALRLLLDLTDGSAREVPRP